MAHERDELLFAALACIALAIGAVCFFVSDAERPDPTTCEGMSIVGGE